MICGFGGDHGRIAVCQHRSRCAVTFAWPDYPVRGEFVDQVGGLAGAQLEFALQEGR